MRILLVDYHNETRRSLELSLISHCFAVDAIDNGKKALQLAIANTYDVVLSDLVIPFKSAIEICVELRSRQNFVPFIVMSAITEISMKVSALNNGVDDYVTRPFAIEELIARIRAVGRRKEKHTNRTTFQLADLELDNDAYTVKRNNKQIYLTRKEFMLLRYLLEQKHKVVTRADIMEHVWDRHLDPFSNTIESHIVNLRKKIDKKAPVKLIHTVPGRGYKIDTKK